MNGTKLLDAEGLLAELFPQDARPTVRWLREQQRRRAIPFIKLGRLVFFDPLAVREAIATRHTVAPRQGVRVKAKMSAETVSAVPVPATTTGKNENKSHA